MYPISNRDRPLSSVKRDNWEFPIALKQNPNLAHGTDLGPLNGRLPLPARFSPHFFIFLKCKFKEIKKTSRQTVGYSMSRYSQLP